MRSQLTLLTYSFIAAAVSASSLFAQTQIQVTLTTNGPVGLAPAFVAFHDGSYDLFDNGGMATPGLEDLAEVGNLTAVLGEAAGAGANAAGFAPGGPFAPNGGTGSTELLVDNSESSLTFASMVLPSNDWFIGNGNSIDVSSLLGAALGTSMEISFSNVYDAGTEAEDFAFAPGGGLVGITTMADPPNGTSTANPISLVSGPDPFAGFANIEPASFDTTSIDFTGGNVATLTLTVVPEPATYVLAICGVVGYAMLRKRS